MRKSRHVSGTSIAQRFAEAPGSDALNAASPPEAHLKRMRTTRTLGR